MEEVRKGAGDVSGNKEGVPWSQPQLIMLRRSCRCLRFSHSACVLVPTYLGLQEPATLTPAGPLLVKTPLVLRLMCDVRLIFLGSSVCHTILLYLTWCTSIVDLLWEQSKRMGRGG